MGRAARPFRGALWAVLAAAFAIGCTSDPPNGTKVKDTAGGNPITGLSAGASTGTGTGATGTGTGGPTTSTFTSGGGGTQLGQCNVAIPGDAVVVNSTAQSAANGAFLWVCSGQTLTYNGDNGSILVETGGTANVNGQGTTVWALDGASVTLFQSGNAVNRENNVTIDNQSAGANPTSQCNPVDVNTQNAPGNGC